MTNGGREPIFTRMESIESALALPIRRIVSGPRLALGAAIWLAGMAILVRRLLGAA